VTAITLNQEGVRAMWGWIRAGLERILRKTDPDWLPEDVWTDLMSGNAVCRVYRDAIGDDLGFVILQRMDYKHGSSLFVWCMAGELWSVREELVRDLDEVAKSIGAKTVMAKSPRKGYARVGFKLKEYVYEREVQ
jgi:hypothetical protein